MTKLLYLEASPRRENSVSSRVAGAFLDTYRAHNPDHEIEHRPLFEVELPPFSGEGADQKMAQIAKMVAGGDIEAVGEWAGVVEEINRLKSADKVLLSSPMWNYSIPYRLKHWLDVVIQPGLTWKLNDKFEYIGQITGVPLQMILSSGSPYEMRFPLEQDGLKTDFQRVYIEHAFRFIGFTDFRLIKIQPTGMLTGEKLEAMIEERCAEAREAAESF